ncbi:MAG: hypothetical protein WCP36_09445 [Methanomicrobiales archaeon]
MDADHFIKSVNLNESTQAILYETEQLTGKSFDFIHNSKLPVRAIVKIARSSMDHHIITYSGTDFSLLNHHIAHECGHIQRYYAAPKENRLMPVSDGQTHQNAITDIEKYDKNFLKSLPIDLRYQIIPVWINGLIQQVTNLPSDTYIEKWIFDNYPEIRNDQQQSLRQTHTEAIKTLNPKVHSQFPKIIIESSIAMNYAFYKKIDETTGSKYFQNYKQSSIRAIGEDLYRCIGDEDRGLVADISISNEWARILQIKDWFKWTDFENIPPGYGKT